MSIKKHVIFTIIVITIVWESWVFLKTKPTPSTAWLVDTSLKFKRDLRDASQNSYYGTQNNVLNQSLAGGAIQFFIKIRRYGVSVSISPNWQEGSPGTAITYIVTVMNTGNVEDNYNLNVSDNAGWNPSISPTSLTVLPAENGTATLDVTIPENAVPCTDDNIIVVVTSLADSTVTDNDSCIAHVFLPKAEFSLVTLYEVGLNVDLYLSEGSKLVVKFYTYGDIYENENVFWIGTTPARVKENGEVPHPENIAVKKVRLDLTTDNTENVISTVATFTVTRSALNNRLVDIYLEWPFALPERKNVLMKEITDIYLQWPFAPF